MITVSTPNPPCPYCGGMGGYHGDDLCSGWNPPSTEDEAWLNSPTCIECGWHPEDEGHDDDCSLSAADEDGSKDA